ncbi:hypothetical protein EA772_17300 [Pedobacter sp. G11]|uniref:sensor histidine kinase n=1 Tax=Pedobacter sp. G11 TaxID=2482728 RepID=UPI000F5E44CD|nr:histidine kinase [Pedobacter sp. G11]AZI27002.1 hypothetical protein EA772_17300 [Pedobacter sp. G11]
MINIKKSPPFIRIQNWLVSKKFHIIIWLVFMLYESVIVGLFSGQFGNLINYILFYSLNISMFYVHTHIILESGLKRKNQIWWKLPFLLSLELLVYLMIYIGFDYLITDILKYFRPRKIGTTMQYILGPVYRAIYFMFFSTGYYFLLKFLSERKKTEELEHQRLNNMIQIARSENAFLKAQIQPHLLFNTLDFIYQNARDHSPIAAETILSLSEMMRYSVDSNKDKDFISLGEEINQVENLINLHQLRKHHQLQIRFWYDDYIKKVEIIPLILITLVENIFKHGDLLSQSHPAEIKLYLQNNDLIIETSNQIAKVKEKPGFNSGIKNITKRLAYAYGDQSTFESGTTEDNYYKVRVTIKL